MVLSVSVFFLTALDMITGTLLPWWPQHCCGFSFWDLQEPIFAFTFLATFQEPPPRSPVLVPVVSGTPWIGAAGDQQHGQHHWQQQEKGRGWKLHRRCLLFLKKQLYGLSPVTGF